MFPKSEVAISQGGIAELKTLSTRRDQSRKPKKGSIKDRPDKHQIERKLVSWLLLTHVLVYIILGVSHAQASPILMKVCDTREIKTVTSRVCMLYKRTKNSDLKLDRHGNLRITRGAKGDYSPAKLAIECCKNGCPPHIFAYNC